MSVDSDAVFSLVPSWPANDKIYMDVANRHNELLRSSQIAGEQLTGSRSITLVMICAALGVAVPSKYFLDTKRAKGIADHPTYVREYINAMCCGKSMSEKGRRVVAPVRQFSDDLGVTIQTVNEGLRDAFKIWYP